MTTLQAIVLAIIEGLTEFLPVSSTGHLVIGSALMGMENNVFLKLFTVAIQFGAILSVVVLYFKKFFRSVDFYFKLLIAFIPAAIFGFLLADRIDAFMENITGICVALFAGGIVFLFIHKLIGSGKTDSTDEMNNSTAFKIGLFQCLALFPGVSRSGATIIGGLSQKLTPRAAAEFSFFLAVPTMFAATAKKCLDFYQANGFPNNEQIQLLVTGNIVAFIVAMIAIKGFIAFLNKKGFVIFGWYRIALAAILLFIHFTLKPLNFSEETKSNPNQIIQVK
jgi:undecaprenyl-diphosphatase